VNTTLQVRRTFAATREVVFRAWTDPDWFSRWFGGANASIPRAELDVRVGGDYRVDWETEERSGSLFGRYLEVERPERLVYTFCWEGLPPEVTPTQVTVEFHDRGDETEVVLTHERQPSERVRAFHNRGWTASFDKLAEVVEQ
jgi:uncharacterized protein YndB with AHSA1/START domain